MNIQMVSFTKQGGKLCKRLVEAFLIDGHSVMGFCKYETEGLSLLSTNINDFTRNAFAISDYIVFIGAAGIAVRAIAPYVNKKQSDPAVLVIDDTARFVIPILSGHIGGANALAQKISDILCAQAVITTSTDCNGRFSVDTWAVRHGCHIVNVDCIKYISAAILKGEEVGLYSDFPIEGNLPKGLSLSQDTKAGISISLEKNHCFEHTLQLIPKQYVIGIGCRKNIHYNKLMDFVKEVLQEKNILQYEIDSIASISLKAEEAALLALCRTWKVPFHTYSAQELSLVSGDFKETDFVRSVTGVGNVCERAAVKASGHELIVRKTCRDGITVAIAKKEWRCRF